MQCPVDGTTLAMSDRQGIEIDYCPKCRGVWLDRGELDKLIERSTEFDAPRGPAPAPQQQHYEQPRREERRDDRREHRSYDDDDHYRKDSHHGQHKKKKEGFLGDLFDF